ncbi:hypothetical protein BKH46_08350 [Helicobacter sp. 12S02634-8]|uniref:hypothetical protein n=1 Tax=Helicobacter sp. 12S02634-8 TaxID=1476199 RepID=UPI000BA59EC2|nr:hypothetical protein [Helicobacter sp. 12S02634-8]PAF46241.1 hypothetical protein BKH46_08350 [Helicobacter sp. 12S02634-8]
MDDLVLYKSQRLISGFFQDGIDGSCSALGINEHRLFNMLIYFFQRAATENLFIAMDRRVHITQTELIEKLGVDRTNATRVVGVDDKGEDITVLDTWFQKLFKSQITIRNIILPEIKEEKLVVENGLIKFYKYDIANFGILSFWGRKNGVEEKTYSFTLNPFLVSLSHLQTLIEKNGVGYSKLNLTDLKTIQTPGALRLCELIAREKEKRGFKLTAIELEQILYLKLKRKNFTVARDLNALCLQVYNHFKTKISFCIKKTRTKEIESIEFDFVYPDDANYGSFKVGNVRMVKSLI